MIPLYIQLQTRRQILKGIRANLALYLGRDFSNHALEFVGVDGYGLDLDFGTSSKAVTCYFRPDILFPRCETMDPGDSDESILENLDNTDPESGAASAFSDHLLWAFEHYGFEGDEELKNSLTDSSSDLYSWTGAEYKGWIVDRSLDNSKDSLALRLPTFWFERKRRFQNETRSHAITLAEVSRCNKPHPGMSEVAVLIEEIMDGMKEQKRKLKSMAKHEKLPIFHHILPFSITGATVAFSMGTLMVRD
ncbi:hypothetical protein N7456_005005 [Penicillium angulare]|uniref:Uncharacterized protein n=1 Tax=Penicillium angulare TaxID=116970 RepID=A0A9W9KJ50_9EURO|nr:hypothetical protein N7456_005005 [Penicillium angulare]